MNRWSTWLLILSLLVHVQCSSRAQTISSHLIAAEWSGTPCLVADVQEEPTVAVLALAQFGILHPNVPDVHVAVLASDVVCVEQHSKLVCFRAGPGTAQSVMEAIEREFLTLDYLSDGVGGAGGICLYREDLTMSPFACASLFDPGIEPIVESVRSLLLSSGLPIVPSPSFRQQYCDLQL